MVVDQIVGAGIGDHGIARAVGVDRGDVTVAEVVDNQFIAHQIGRNGDPAQTVVVEQHRFGCVVIALQRDAQHVGVIGSVEIGDTGQRSQRRRCGDVGMAGAVVGGIGIGGGVGNLHRGG